MNEEMKGSSFIVKICLIVVCIIMLSGIAWFCLDFGLLFSKKPLQPECTNGEFPYKLVYELNGKTHTVQGKYICRYDGIDLNEGRGKYRVWVGYVEGTNDKHVFMCENEEVSIYCYIGDAGYYMGDDKYSGHTKGKPLQPRLFCKPKNPETVTQLSEDEIFEKYKIRILEYKLANPIENSFR